jgi:hypothetical protein
MSNVPDSPNPEEVHADHGGWISGPSASDEVRAVDLADGDVIVRDGREVTVQKCLPHGSGWMIIWHAGRASGVFDVTASERITRVRKAGTQ